MAATTGPTRLKNFFLDGDNQWGLKPIKMHGLGQVVALFGPNGSGKTRILRAVEKLLPGYLESPNQEVVEVYADKALQIVQAGHRLYVNLETGLLA